jgi:ATP-binding cassette subfamily F protein uup
MLLGLEKPDSGKIIKGDTVRFGYYSQQGLEIKEDKRVIEVITDIAEYIEIGKGEKLTAAGLLKMFLFDPKKQHNFVSVLSGGEKRRLFLLTVLMQKPNFLVLDEPTNDLDIETLNVLEEFLENFEGCLVVVTHDRYFMDHLVDSLFVFEGEGMVRPFNGNYQDYLNELEDKRLAALAAKQSLKTASPATEKKAETPPAGKKKLSYNEQRELEMIEKEIPRLQSLKQKLEELLSLGEGTGDQISQWGNELVTTLEQIDNYEMRWIELSEEA